MLSYVDTSPLQIIGCLVFQNVATINVINCHKSIRAIQQEGEKVHRSCH